MPESLDIPPRRLALPTYHERMQHLMPAHPLGDLRIRLAGEEADMHTRIAELGGNESITDLLSELDRVHETFLGAVRSQIASEINAIEPVGGPIAFVATDLLVSLAPMFLPAGSVSDITPNRAVGSEAVSPSIVARLICDGVEPVVAIQYNAIHAEPFNGVAATHRAVVFDGLVVIHDEGVLTRYVDWNSVMGQLGVMATKRPMLGFDRAGVVEPMADPSAGSSS